MFNASTEERLRLCGDDAGGDDPVGDVDTSASEGGDDAASAVVPAANKASPLTLLALVMAPMMRLNSLTASNGCPGIMA